MMRRLLPFTMLVLAGWTGQTPALAEPDHQALVESAFAGISDTYRDYWAFRETRTSAGRVTIGRYDPTREAGERWSLESVDGRPPSDEDLIAYRAERDQDGAGDDNTSGADLIAPGSLKLIDSSAETLSFSFSPVGDEDEAFFEELTGRLTIDRAGRYVHALTLENEGAVKPAKGVRISEFRMHMAFTPLTPDGPAVPSVIEVNIRGRAYLAFAFDETEKITYDEFVRVADER